MKNPKKLTIKVTIKHDSPCLLYLHVIRMLQSVYGISSCAGVLCKQGIFKNFTKFFVNSVQFLKMPCLQNGISSPTEVLCKQGIFKNFTKFFVNSVQFLKMPCLQNGISSPTEVLCKQGIFKNCTKFTKKHLC